MNMRYVITDDTFPDNLLDEIIRLDIFPRPAAVLLDGVFVHNGLTFGFNNNDAYPVLENTYTNFYGGNFYSGFFVPF